MEALLVQITVKATVVLIAAWLVTRVMTRGSAAGRHLVWTLAIVAVLALPAVQLAGPRLDVPLLPAEAAAPLAVAVEPVEALGEALGETLGSDPIHGSTQPLDTPREWGLTPTVPAVPAVSVDWSTVLLVVWLAGVTFALLRLAAGLAWASWITRRATPVTDAHVIEALDEAAFALRVVAPVSLRSSAETTIPVACGIWTPAILLPEEAREWSVDRLRVVLLHEMAHVARRDCLVQSIAQLTRAAHWFNPLAHLATARLRAEQERACDDLVLAAGTDAPVYADHLFEIARSFRAERFPAWATLAMARPSQLEGRVMDILDDRRNRRPLTLWVRAAVSAAALVLILPIGAMQLTAAAGPEARRSQTKAAAPAFSAGERVAASMALEASEAAPAPAPAAVEAQWPVPGPFAPDAVVGGVGAFVDVLPNFDFDFDFGFDFGFDFDFDFDADNAQAQTQSQDTAVTDETRRRVADALITALNDDNEDVREQALAALAGMRDPRAIPGLLRALRDSSAGVREQALNALAQFDTAEAADGILSALKDQSPDVREHAARHVAALASRGRLNDPKYVASLTALLKDAAPDVRVQAVVALGRMRRQEGVASLLPMLKDMNTDVREQTAVALGIIADPTAIDALTAALKDAEPDVREQAARALGSIARGQRRGNLRGPLPPLPPVPPVPPRSPQAKIDTDAIDKAFTQAQKQLQFELPKLQLQLQQQEFLNQSDEIRQANEDIRRAAEAIRQAQEDLRRQAR